MKQRRAFESFLRTYNLTLEDGTNHCIVKQNGKTVASVARMPRETYTYRQTVRQLVNRGILPESAKIAKI